MGVFNRLFGLGKKESATARAIASFTVNQAIWTPRRYDKFSEEGYQKNVIVYRCVKEVARSAASVPWLLFKGDREIETHPLLTLLTRPNPVQGGAEFWEWFFSAYQISGNSYLEANRGLTGTRPPAELWVLRPDRMKIVPGPTGMVSRYEYDVNGQTVKFEIDQIKGTGNILHFKDIHPLNDWYGMSPLEPAAFSVDQHNEAGAWNQALLQNGARPSGAFIWEQKPDDKERKRLEDILLNHYQGASNAGRPIVLGGKLDWKEMGLSPKDMDFLNSKLTSARDICRAFGVPPVLVVEGEGTYNNRDTARTELWEQTVIPLLDRAVDALNNWLVPMFGPGLRLGYDLDCVSALIPRRVQHRRMTIEEYTAGVITLNEARAALDYEELPDGDTVKQPPMSAFGALSAPGPKGHKATLHPAVVSIADEIDLPSVKMEVTSMMAEMLDELVKEFGEQVVAEIGAAASFENSSRVQSYIRQRSAELVSQVNDTTRDALRKAIAEGVTESESVEALAERINTVFDKADSSRARNIAQTESTRAAGFGSVEAITQAGIATKEWVSTQDGATRESHAEMDGQVVATDGEFISPEGGSAAYPGGFGIAEEDIGCRCAAIAHQDASEKSMTPEQRKACWDDREVKRKAGAKRMIPVIRKAFDLQRKAVLHRLQQVTG